MVATESEVVQPREKTGVIVVDDVAMVRDLVQLGLERNGFEVWTTPDGREAIDLYQKHREKIAVVLLDIQMPGLDGPETLDALRDIDPEVTACFMSGTINGYEPEELLQYGAKCVIAKPFRLNQLANILRMVLQGVPADLLPSGKVSPK